jgi:hypothetical protein
MAHYTVNALGDYEALSFRSVHVDHLGGFVTIEVEGDTSIGCATLTPSKAQELITALEMNIAEAGED